jgi:hypothetical protein
MASAHVNRVNRLDTWLHRSMLQKREEGSCQLGSVHTWHLAHVGVLTNDRFAPEVVIRKPTGTAMSAFHPIVLKNSKIAGLRKSRK